MELLTLSGAGFVQKAAANLPVAGLVTDESPSSGGGIACRAAAVRLRVPLPGSIDRFTDIFDRHFRHAEHADLFRRALRQINQPVAFKWASIVNQHVH